MNSKIEIFIENEKEISAYKLEMLEMLGEKRYKNRLILLEKDFLSYPFLDLKITDLNEMRDAVTLFRIDRDAFSKKYESQNLLDSPRKFTKKDLLKVNSKINWLNEACLTIVNDIIPNTLRDDTHGKGVFASRHRARVQVILFSLTRYFFLKIKSLEKKLESKDLSYAELLSIDKAADNILKEYDHGAFSFYNESILQLQEILTNTPNENSFIASIYPLKNICNSHTEKLFLERVLDCDKNLLSQTGRPIKRKYIERAYSINTGLSRVGNENVTLLYRSIYSKNGNCLDKLLEKDFYNLNTGSDYKKAISTIPIWKMDKAIFEPELKREVFGLIGTSNIPMVDSVISGEKEIISSINNTCTGRIYIDANLSKIMIGATRTESEKILEAKKHVDLLINSLNREYMQKFIANTIFRKEDSELRKQKVKDIIGSIFNG